MTGFTFFSYAPPRSLAPFVDAIWGVRGSADYHIESVLPNRAMELIVNLGPPQAIVAYGDRPAHDVFARACLSGIQDQPLVHASEAGADHIAVRFRPGGAHAFFDLPMDALINQVVHLSDLIGEDAAASLRDRLLGLHGDLERAHALAVWLLGRRVSVHPYFGTVRRALDLLRGGSYGARVADVCEQMGLSNRYLIQQFRTTVGLAPKAYARIERFQAVIDGCRGASEVRWSRLAAATGYTDQSHLIRDFRRFAGVTPTEFLARRTPDESHLIVG